MISKIKKRFRKFREHPLTSANPFAALFRYVFFNVRHSLFNEPKIHQWVNGIKFYAQKGDAGIVPNIYFKLFDYEDSKFILDTLNHNDVFVDIGANVGHFSLLAASKKSKVIAFEPIPETYKKLVKNINLNNFNIEVLNKGVGNSIGKLFFSTEKGVMNSVVTKPNNNCVEVEVLPLDEILKNTNPTMLKIDVEGYEWFVLQGGLKTLGNTSLKYILIELNNSGKKFEINDQDIHQLLISNGFYPYQYIVNDKTFIRLDTFRRDKFNTLYIRSNA